LVITERGPRLAHSHSGGGCCAAASLEGAERSGRSQVEALRAARVTAVACSSLFTVCATLAGEVFSWGAGVIGRLPAAGCGAIQTRISFAFFIRTLRTENHE
jgi:hypothetical protein